MATAVDVKFKELEDLRTMLTNQKSPQDPNANLNNHMTEIMNHIIIHCPKQALDKLEEISYLVKHKDVISLEEFLKVNQVKLYAGPSDQATSLSTAASVTASSTLFVVSAPIFKLFTFIFIFRNKLRPMTMEMLLTLSQEQSAMFQTCRLMLRYGSGQIFVLGITISCYSREVLRN